MKKTNEQKCVESLKTVAYLLACADDERSLTRTEQEIRELVDVTLRVVALATETRGRKKKYFCPVETCTRHQKSALRGPRDLNWHVRTVHGRVEESLERTQSFKALPI